MGIAASILERHKRLNARKPGMVDAQEVKKAESALAEDTADVQVKEIEVMQVQLRQTQLQRRAEQVRRLTKVAKEFKATVENPGPDLW